MSKAEVLNKVLDVFNMEFEEYEIEEIELSLNAKGTTYEFSIEKITMNLR